MQAKPIPADFVTIEWMLDRIVVDEPTGCHVWQGKREWKEDPYGLVYRRGSTRMAHRVSWALSGRELDPDKTMDHICRNRLCVNPEHLEQVSQRENTSRGTSPIGELLRLHDAGVCGRGHDLAQVGFWKAGKSKTCAACGRERVARYESKKKVA